jgi:hypothetical protein
MYIVHLKYVLSFIFKKLYICKGTIVGTRQKEFETSLLYLVLWRRFSSIEVRTTLFRKRAAVMTRLHLNISFRAMRFQSRRCVLTRVHKSCSMMCVHTYAPLNYSLNRCHMQNREISKSRNSKIAKSRNSKIAKSRNRKIAKSRNLEIAKSRNSKIAKSRK